MGELMHWTESSVDGFLYRIGFDFVRQIEQSLNAAKMSQADLAKALGVTEGRVSQILNNPGNITLRKMIEYARALKRKVSVITYNDGDPRNRKGPIAAEVFVSCWERAGKPADFLALRDGQTAAATGSIIQSIPGYGRGADPASLHFANPIAGFDQTANNPGYTEGF